MNIRLFTYIHLMKNLLVLSLIFALPVFIHGANLGGKEIKQEKITVTGKALHAKAGAVVETKKGVYYIKGKSDWGKWYGKKVKVTGILEKVIETKDDLVNENGEYMQGMVGTILYIDNAQVTLVR